MSAPADPNDRQVLYDSVPNNKDDESKHGTTRNGDEDGFHLELLKEYESGNTVGDNLKT